MSHYPPQHHQQQPHQHYQAPSLPTEDEQFRSFFRSHLATLVVNSRPIIQSLTQVAADQLNNYSRATVVSEELVRRIHEVSRPLPPLQATRQREEGKEEERRGRFLCSRVEVPLLSLLFFFSRWKICTTTKALTLLVLLDPFLRN